MATLKVYNGSSWDTCVGKTYDGSAWVEKMKFYDGSAFQDLYTSLTVSMAAGGITNARVFSTCYAAVSFNTDGNEWASTNAGSLTVSRGQWLDVGTSAEVWIEYTVNSGSLNWLGWAGRKQLTTTRTAGVFKASPAGFHTANVTFRMYDAASGGNLLDTKTYTISAEYDDGS